MGMEVRRFIWGYLDSNMYVLIEADQALVIDPVESYEAFAYLRPFHEITVLLTHEHFDHICGLNKLRAEHNCIVIAQEKCSERIQNSKTNFSAMAETMLELSGKEREKRIDPFVCDKADRTFDENLNFTWSGNKIEIFATPGHSPGSACVGINDDVVFSGDTLLENGPMLRFPGGNVRDYKIITIPQINRLKNNKNMIVFPGHGNSFKLDSYLILKTSTC